MKITLRTRLNGRLPDPQGKYRDEITQEATIEFEDDDLRMDVAIEAVKEQLAVVRAQFYAELGRLGGVNYAEV